MTPMERMTRRLSGQQVDRPPNFDIMMTLAVHHIGERLSRYYLDHRVLCAANMAMLEDFSLDIVQAISDPYREAADWGAAVDFPEDGLPVCKTPLVADAAAIGRLKTPDPRTARRMSDRLEAIRRFRAEVGGTVPIMGWVEGALAEAADLMGVSNLLLAVVDDPEGVTELLERCTEVEIAFAEAQVEAGADIIGLGDAVASQVSPRMYARYALPYERRIFAAVRERGAIARLHICGDITGLLPRIGETGAQIVDLDWMVDMDAARAAVGDIALCGNVDPVAVMLQGSPTEVYAATQACAKGLGPHWISAAGCEIPDGTPRPNLHAQTRALADLGSS